MTRGQVNDTITFFFSENARRSKKKKIRQAITLDTGNMSKIEFFIYKKWEYNRWSISVPKKEKV